MNFEALMNIGRAAGKSIFKVKSKKILGFVFNILIVDALTLIFGKQNLVKKRYFVTIVDI